MRSITLAMFYMLTAAGTVAQADGTVEGEGRFEKIKGRPGNYIGLYEWNLYLSADAGATIGQSRRLGAGLGGGRYTIDAPAGWYTMVVTQPIFFARPKVVTDVQIVNGQVSTVNPELCIDYSCYHVADGDWTPFDTPWYQTFIATGTSIIRIQWMLAGWNTSTIRASVHQDNGGNITTWPQVGPTKSEGAGYGDAWVGFRSGDIPTVPGQRYAIKLTGQDGSFAIRCRDEDGNGYAGGQAFDGSGNPQNKDLLITVFSDNDGTVVPYIDMTLGSVEDLAGSTGVWGQTFRATGASLAAADCFTAGEGTWDIDVEFRIRQNGPGGAQVGPTKTAQALYQAATCGLVGVSYAPDEVPLTVGSTYFIEMTPAAGSAPFTAYKFHSQSQNGYPYGDAYRNGVLQSNVDLEMTIIEYESSSPPPPELLNPSFEDGLNSWTETGVPGWWNDGTFPDPHTAQHGSHWASSSHGTGDGNDTSLYQTVSVTGSEPLALDAYIQTGGAAGAATVGMRLLDGGIGGAEIGSVSFVVPPHQGAWTPIATAGTPTQNTVTVEFFFSQAAGSWNQNGVNVDNVTLTEEPCTPPSITSHPSSQTRCAGETASFSVSASGTPPLSYQWQRNTGTGWSNVSGATASTYSFTAQASHNGYQYRCRVTNSCGTATSNAATLTVKTAPSITSHPASQTRCAGETASFSVSASGTPPLSYQWQRNTGTGWSNVSGATTSTYSFTAQMSHNGNQYRCRVTNSCGTATSNAATLTVKVSPVIAAWWSVRTHGGLGELAIELDPTAAGGVVVSETRRGGVQKIAVDFDRDVSMNYVPGGVVLICGGATVIGESLVNGGTTLEIDIGGSTDETCCMIDVGASVECLVGDSDCMVRILTGDTNNDGCTNLIDMAYTKSMNGADPMVPGNAGFDVNVDGYINLIDMALVRSVHGNSASCP